jgi:acyl-coenzyme A thioesterase PaaI-like protein
MERLDNSRWGLDSNCFVCEERNPGGLRVPFFADREQQIVTAAFELDDRFSGAPTYVHGGVVLAIMDEAMAWATIALAGCFAVTKETTTRFKAPVMVGQSYSVRARIAGDDQSELDCRAEVIDEAGRICAEASATFVALGPAQVVEAAGAEVPDSAREFIRG